MSSDRGRSLSKVPRRCCASTFSTSSALFSQEQHSRSSTYTLSSRSDPSRHNSLNIVSLCPYPSYHFVATPLFHLSSCRNVLSTVSLCPASHLTMTTFIADVFLLRSLHSTVPTEYSLSRRLRCVPTLSSFRLYRGLGSFSCFSFTHSL